jgi:hypothetical protein
MFDLPGGKFLGLKIRTEYRTKTASANKIKIIIVPSSVSLSQEIWNTNRRLKWQLWCIYAWYRKWVTVLRQPTNYYSLISSSAAYTTKFLASEWLDGSKVMTLTGMEKSRFFEHFIEISDGQNLMKVCFSLFKNSSFTNRSEVDSTSTNRNTRFECWGRMVYSDCRFSSYFGSLHRKSS